MPTPRNILVISISDAALDACKDIDSLGLSITTENGRLEFQRYEVEDSDKPISVEFSPNDAVYNDTNWLDDSEDDSEDADNAQGDWEARRDRTSEPE